MYEVVVLTKALCAHPAFQKSPPKENEVRCYATTEDQVTKPKSLTEMENAASSQFLKEYGLFGGGSKVQSPKQLFTQLFHIESGDIDSGFEQINAILEALKIKASAKSQPAGQIPVKKQKQITTPDADIDSLEGFWSGKICLHGGDGWWRYELCYGRVVIISDLKSNFDILA